MSLSLIKNILYIHLLKYLNFMNVAKTQKVKLYAPTDPPSLKDNFWVTLDLIHP